MCSISTHAAHAVKHMVIPKYILINLTRYVTMKKKIALGPSSMSSAQKVPKAVKEHLVKDKLSSFHQPVMASHSIRLSIISLAFHAQNRRKKKGLQFCRWSKQGDLVFDFTQCFAKHQDCECAKTLVFAEISVAQLLPVNMTTKTKHIRRVRPPWK